MGLEASSAPQFYGFMALVENVELLATHNLVATAFFRLAPFHTPKVAGEWDEANRDWSRFPVTRPKPAIMALSIRYRSLIGEYGAATLGTAT
ncbi:hypothetical protein RsS62_51370 [Rhizobium dioscoreae]|nr:hypothetical protein RsS62_51370 [Rhizobium dioscoreae]